ncbi:MAG: hypothetical protein ND866_31025 [Pyrinomonadaceae bacterium]|nr:hypothetical protein [Pyrinomonadaceae bacterium]
MKPERKFIELKDLKVSNDGAGSIEGYRSVFGEVDDGGNIIVKGAFEACIPEYNLIPVAEEFADQVRVLVSRFSP